MVSVAIVSSLFPLCHSGVGPSDTVSAAFGVVSTFVAKREWDV